MKTLIFLILLSALCEAFVDHEVVLRRARRQAMTYSDLRTLQCVRGCIGEFNSTLATINRARSTSFMNDALLNKKKLDKFCQSYDSLDSCIAECNAESSPIVQSIVSMFEPLDIICKTRYEEFVSYLPCYRKSKAATQVRCSNICGEPEAFYSDMQKKFNTPIMQRNEDGIVSAFNELIQTTCNYASCHHRCQWRVIIEKCPGENGQNAAEFMSSFSEQAIKSVSKGMKAVAPQIVVPDDCLSREDSSPAINRSGRTNSANVIDEEY